MVLPLSGMGSWAAVVIGALMSLHVLGINLAPLLTVGMSSLLSAYPLSPTFPDCHRVCETFAGWADIPCIQDIADSMASPRLG